MGFFVKSQNNSDHYKVKPEIHKHRTILNEKSNNYRGVIGDWKRTCKEKAEANLDKPLVAILDTIYQEDQKYRQQIEGIEKVRMGI